MYCRRCEYDLRNGPDDRTACPECGASYRPDDPDSYALRTDTTRGIRRFGWACVLVLGGMQAVALSISGGVWVWGWWHLGFAPSPYRDRPWPDSLGPTAAFILEYFDGLMVGGLVLGWFGSLPAVVVLMVLVAVRVPAIPNGRERRLLWPMLLVIASALLPEVLLILDVDPIWWMD
ncbi:MAG: hypothetical protein AAF328_06010 [Planctomycetota bacterium]